MTTRPVSSEVLVVIGSGGMGLSVARRVGAGRLIVLADVDRACLDSAAAALSSGGHQVLAREVDVTSRPSMAALAEMAEGRGRVTAVVHTGDHAFRRAAWARSVLVDHR
jgi:NAD(P)-dependent dehydrogenase (short-subunit alcohol dehydrogenase family)